MPAADGDSAGEEEDGSAGSDEDGWEDGFSDTSQLSDITASQRGKLYSLKEISNFLERTKESGLIGLSGQERVKLKMQEKAKKKTAEKYSVEQLLEKVHSGMEAVQYFGKGIEAMLNALEKQTTPAAAAAAISLDDPGVTNKDISVAFCSIAEIFFTDLCMDDGAAEKCKEAIDKALQYDPENPEALQLMASYLFSMEKTQEYWNVSTYLVWEPEVILSVIYTYLHNIS
ncbi:UNVERIFIED_CONTAM: hypothetical protein FKN15_046720 [Acipenser sinensis]